MITLLMLISLSSVIWTLMLVITKLNGKSTTSVSLMHFRENKELYATMPVTSMMIRDLNPNEQDLSQDDTLNAEYSLINTGEDTLFILNVNPDCICTDYSLSSEFASPGDSISLELMVDLENKYGENLVHVVIEANTEKRMEMIRLPFYVEYAKSDDSNEITTRRLFTLKKMKVGEKKKIQSFIVNNSSKSSFIEVLTSCDCLEVEPRRMLVKSDDRVEYSIIVEPHVAGEYSEYFLLRIDGGEDLIRIDVKGNILNN